MTRPASEPGRTCPTPAMAGQPLHYCGNGASSRRRECDDGNAIAGDGCSATCRRAGLHVPHGRALRARAGLRQRHIAPGEACDDGNIVGGDGCARLHMVEPGWTARQRRQRRALPMVRPTPAATAPGGPEQCDDGNTARGDGCSSTCQVEPGYTCPTPGMACKKIEFCGDGVVSLDIGEQCDDGNMVSGDGCSAACTIEPNYVCPRPASPASPRSSAATARPGQRAVRRRQRRLGRRLLLHLPARARLAVPDAGHPLHREEVRRRHRRRQRAVRRRQQRLRRRVHRDLPARARLRLRDPGHAPDLRLPQDQVRRRDPGGLRAVRRREPNPLRRLLAHLHHRAQVRGRHLHRRLRRRPQVPAGGLRRRQHDRGRRLLVHLHGRDGLELPGGQPAAPRAARHPRPVPRHALLQDDDARARAPRLQRFSGNGGAVGLVQSTLGADSEPVWN